MHLVDSSLNKYSIALLTLVLLVPQGYAQTPTAPTPQNDKTTIVSNANEVTVDLVVHNKKNEPVIDLKPGFDHPSLRSSPAVFRKERPRYCRENSQDGTGESVLILGARY